MKKFKIPMLILLYLVACYNIYYHLKPNILYKTQYNINSHISIPKQKNTIGRLIIDKLNINQPLYDINDNKNNVEENVTILTGTIEPNKNNSIVFLAAHSGTGKIAYFKNLDKLKSNDKITLIYKEHTYYYEVKNYWEIKKNGTITVPKEEKNQLILTTCSPKKDNYQLIINCIQKESI